MYILNPGMDHTETVIIQHYYLPKIRGDICTQIKVWNNCHINKKKLKYGYLPAKEEDAIPWDRILVDLIVPYKILR